MIRSKNFNSGTIFRGDTMKAMKKSVLAAALVCAFGFNSGAFAGVVVDLFTDPAGSAQTVVSPTLGTFTTNQAGPFPTTNVVGGYRDMSIVQIENDFSAGNATLTATNGRLILSNDTGVASRGVVTWDGANLAGNDGLSVSTGGLGGVNFTAGGADRFLANVLAADLGFDYKITVWDTSGNKSTLSASVQFQINPPTTEVSDYLYSWFNLASGTYCDGVASPPTCADPTTQLDFSILHTGGAIDFSHIGALQLELTNARQVSVDFALGSIGTNTTPEPAGLALVGVALLGATFASRRRNSSKA